MNEKNLSFEESINRLDEIVRSLEKGDAPLSESLKLFEEGTGLISNCDKLLSEAEQTVVKLKKGADGEPVEKLFVTGNHDFEGWWYGDMTLDMHVQGYSEEEAAVRLGMAKCWEEAFHEPYVNIRRRSIRGYDFIGAEWHEGKTGGEASVIKWLEDHARELKGDRPFFFFRHAPLAGTVPFSDEEGGSAAITEAFRKFPNCVYLNGHVHWTLNDERSVWHEGFTAISVPSLSYTTIPHGYDNGSDSRAGDSKLGMPRLPSRDNLEEAQGLFVSVYEDRLEIERRDFDRMVEAAPAWIIPLDGGCAKAFDRKTRAAAYPVPQFSAGATVDVHTANADTRNACCTIFMVLGFPAAASERGRVFDYEIRAEFLAGGRPAAVKRYLSPGFYKLREDESARIAFWFDAKDLPECGRYRFAVYPRNCFGASGQPIYSKAFESKPGKASVNPRFAPKM